MLSEAEQIDEIYKVYPRKIAPRAAKKAIAKAVVRLMATAAFPNDATAARRFLWRKTKEYAASPAGQKPVDPQQEFRPHPTTFFNQDRFLDDTAEWQKPNGSRNGKAASSAAVAEGIARINQQVAQSRGDHLRAR